MEQRQVRERMTTAVVAMDRVMPIIDATGEMFRHRVHHLPVVDTHQKIPGIVSTMDLRSIFHRCYADPQSEGRQWYGSRWLYTGGQRCFRISWCPWMAPHFLRRPSSRPCLWGST